MIMELTSITGLKGEVCIPGDKSISHRSVMFGAIAHGITEIHHFLMGADCLATIDCFRKMGIEIHIQKDRGSGTWKRTPWAECSIRNPAGKKQRNYHSADFRYSGRTAICFFSFWR